MFPPLVHSLTGPPPSRERPLLHAYCHLCCSLLLPVVCFASVFCVENSFVRCFLPPPIGMTALLLITSRDRLNSSVRSPSTAIAVCRGFCQSWGQGLSLISGSEGSRLSALMPCNSVIIGSVIGDSRITRLAGDLSVALYLLTSLSPFPRWVVSWLAANSNMALKKGMRACVPLWTRATCALPKASQGR